MHRNVGLKCFYLPKFLLSSLVFAYICISQGSVETHLPCVGMYNDHYYKLSAECVSDRIVKISQSLAKI